MGSGTEGTNGPVKRVEPPTGVGYLIGLLRAGSIPVPGPTPGNPSS